ncbi:hypothetical protein BBJ28_00015689 [Nothophytophthora sp. Chile5]|nr:hypothetical protein BBJ28_00015689 [Nothophytophthora sp. Chile5]
MERVVASDFSPDPAPPRTPWGPGVGVVGIVSATFALGFTEGCLEIERRPIPLRFALRYAAYNVVPSAVWSTVSARHVAAASNVPSSALVGGAEAAGARSAAVANRLILLKSVRSLRFAAGSYGLAWSLWRLHLHQPAMEEEREAIAPCGERVIRLAPVNSPLSRASRRQHGAHIVTVPVAREAWRKQGMNNAVSEVDWASVGLDTRLDDRALQQEEEKNVVDRVLVMEVELSDAESTAAYARRLSAKAARETNAPLCTVAVLPPCGPPLPSSITDAFAVYFNPLSTVLTFVASVCHDRGVTHAFLYTEDEDDSAEAATSSNAETLKMSTPQVAAGLLYRHGITSTILKPPQSRQEGGEEDVDTSNAHWKDSAGNSDVVFFVSESPSAGRDAANKLVQQGLVTTENACFIVEESLSGQRAFRQTQQLQSSMLAAASAMTRSLEGDDDEEEEEEGEEVEPKPSAVALSVADVSDQTLQAIREMVRHGAPPSAIQAAIYTAFGPQRTASPGRIDQFSNMNI